MGLQSLIFGTANRVLNPLSVVDPGGFNPRNQGSYKGVRSIPILKEARYLTQPEAEALIHLEAELAVKKESTLAALRAMQAIESHDSDVTVAHNHYRLNSAKATLAKVESAAAVKAQLKAQRENYAEFSRTLQGTAFEVRARLAAAR